MRIEIKNEYMIQYPTEFRNSGDVGSLEKYLKEREINHEDNLWAEIYNYVLYSSNIEVYDPIHDKDVIEDSDDLTITNMDELMEHFSYLIKPESECCKNQTTNYCGTCGRKLK